MTEHDLPGPPDAGRLHSAGLAWEQERLKEQLENLKSDHSALHTLRTDPQGYTILKNLAEHCDFHVDRALATTYLAIAFSEETTVRRFLFDRFLQARDWDRAAAPQAILANYGDDDSAMEQLVGSFRELTPGELSDSLSVCFDPISPIVPPKGVSEQAWEDWTFAARSALLHLLPRSDLQTLLFDIMRRDPDGPVELTLERILPPWIKRPALFVPAKKAWRIVETWDKNTRSRITPERIKAFKAETLPGITNPSIRTRTLEKLARLEHLWRVSPPITDTPPARVQQRVMYFMEPSPEQSAAWSTFADIVRSISGQITALHPKWACLDDYVHELDSIERRRLPGWRLRHMMFDTDLERRQARITARMAEFPDPGAVRRAFETMLLDRPAIFPKVRDEMDYTFDPVGWRSVAWRALTTSHWTVDEAVEIARLIVTSGPWDNEARKSKEAIVAVVSAWPKEGSVLAFLAEAQCRADVGAFVRDDIAKLLNKAQDR